MGLFNPFAFQTPGQRLKAIEYRLDKERARSRRLDEAAKMFREVEQQPGPFRPPIISQPVPQGLGREGRREEGMPLRQEEPGPRGLMGTVEDVFRLTGQVAGGPGYEEAFQPQPYGLAPPLPRSLPLGLAAHREPEAIPQLTERMDWQRELEQRYRDNLDIRLETLERRNQRKVALGGEPNLTEEGEKQAAWDHAYRVMVSKLETTPLSLAAEAMAPLDIPRQQMKKHVIEPVMPEFEATIPAEAMEVATAVLPMRGLPFTTAGGKPPGQIEEFELTSGQVEEAASWILDPLNLVFFIGPELKALRAAGGTLKVANQMRKTKEVPNFVKAALRAAQSEAGHARVPGELPRPRPGEPLPVKPPEMPGKPLTEAEELAAMRGAIERGVPYQVGPVSGMPPPKRPPVPGDLRPLPEWQVVAQRIRQQFPEAQKIWKGTQLARRGELRARTSGYFKALDEQLGKGVELEEAKRIASREYAGAMEDLKFAEPFITTPEELNAMNQRGLAYARETGHVHEWEDAYNAIATMGERRVPRPHEIKAIRNIFGDDLADAIQVMVRDKDWWETAMDLWMMPKAVRSAFDISFPARQGIMVAPRHPILWSKSVGTSARAMADPAWMGRETKIMLSDPAPVTMTMADGSTQTLKMGDVFGDMGIVLERVEPFYRGQLAERLPLLGIGVRRSNIAFAGAGNKLRTDMTRHWLNTWMRSGVDITPERLEKLGALMNALTGRATIPRGWLFELLQATWWSPQYRLAGPQVVGTILKHGVGALPLRMGRPLVASADPYIAGIAAQNFVAFVGGGIGILSMLKVSGLADVELDPRSSDFGKIRLGPMRINFFGTSQLLVRTIAQAITGTRIDPELGPQAQFRGDPLMRYWKSGASPEFQIIMDLGTGETYLGERMFPSEERGIGIEDIVRRELDPTVEGGGERILPLAWLDIKEAVEQDALQGGLIGGMGMIGIGVQSYEPRAAQELQNIPEFVGGLTQMELQEMKDFYQRVDDQRDAWRMDGIEVPVVDAMWWVGESEGRDETWLQWAIGLRPGSKLREEYRNPEWVQFIVEHADEIREDRPDILKRNYIIDAIREEQAVARR